jgi:hypothetical protein
MHQLRKDGRYQGFQWTLQPNRSIEKIESSHGRLARVEVDKMSHYVRSQHAFTGTGRA